MKTIQIKLGDIEPEDRAFLLVAAVSSFVVRFIGSVDGAMEQLNVAPPGAVVLTQISFPVELILDTNDNCEIISQLYRKISQKYAPEGETEEIGLEIIEG